MLLLLTAWEAEGKGEHPGLLSTLPSECLRSRLNHTSFTHGIRALLDAPLRELRAPGFVVDAVRQIGLTPSYVMVRAQPRAAPRLAPLAARAASRAPGPHALRSTCRALARPAARNSGWTTRRE